MYLFLVNYKKPLEEVEKNLEAHRAYLDKYFFRTPESAYGWMYPMQCFE